jgi:hypothetical protein
MERFAWSTLFTGGFMDSLTVVIQLTGLLMLVPPRPGQAGPTHVLMPEPDHQHVSILGFRDADGSAQHCESGFPGGFCFVRMEGYALDLLPGIAPQPVTLPREIMNLSSVSGDRPVHRDLFGSNPPRDSLRTRITLGGGGVTETCALGYWQFNPVGPMQPDTITMANVARWVIPNVPRAGIRLERRPLRGGSAQLLATLPPDDTIEILIAHIPRREWGRFTRELRNLVTVRTAGAKTGMNKVAAFTAAASSISSAAHFMSYYRLLDRALDRRLPWNPKPRSPGHPNAVCSMTIWRDVSLRSPTTVNCMVVAGTG